MTENPCGERSVRRKSNSEIKRDQPKNSGIRVHRGCQNSRQNSRRIERNVGFQRRADKRGVPCVSRAVRNRRLTFYFQKPT